MIPNKILRVYFVSEKESSRYVRCLERIKSLGMEPVHIPAIRPVAYGEESQGSLRTRHWGSPLTLGEVGCFLAHRSAWLQIAKSESGPVLIVEDDVGFLPEAAKVFLEVAARYDYKRDYVRFYSNWIRRCFRKISIYPNFTIGIPISPGNCCVAYMVGPEVAQKLYDFSVVFHCPSDDFLGQSWVHGVRELHCSPFPCIHDDGRVSVIGERTKMQRLAFWPEFLRSWGKFTNSLQKRYALLKALIRPV
jgi:GR25 family glycosyltransferase involved in LPS biosynthesis